MISFGTCKRIGRRQESSVNEAHEERASAQALGRGSTGEVDAGESVCHTSATPDLQKVLRTLLSRVGGKAPQKMQKVKHLLSVGLASSTCTLRGSPPKQK